MMSSREYLTKQRNLLRDDVRGENFQDFHRVVIGWFFRGKHCAKCSVVYHRPRSPYKQDKLNL